MRGLVPGIGTVGLGGGGVLDVTIGAVLVRERPDRRSRLDGCELVTVMLFGLGWLGGGRGALWGVWTVWLVLTVVDGLILVTVSVVWVARFGPSILCCPLVC